MKQSLDSIIAEAARKLLTLRMTNIHGAGDRIDAENLNSDLDALCSIVDPMILAIGQYAQTHLGLSAETVQRHFADQLRGALEGNAMFEITEAGKQATAYLTGEAAE